MRKLPIYGLAIFIFSVFVGCQSEESEKDNIKTISKIANNFIETTDGEKLAIPPSGGDVTTLFIVRPGEYEKDKQVLAAPLTTAGARQVTKMTNLFKGVTIDWVLAVPAMFASLTGKLIADERNLTVLTYNNIDHGAFLDYIYQTEKGDRFFVVEEGRKIPDLLYTLTAGQKFDPIPDSVYNRIYMVTTSQRGKTEVYPLEY